MANKNKAKGTRAETAVVKFLKDSGISAQRRALTGSKDCGDIEVHTKGYDFIMEIKAGKQTSNPSRTQLEEWLRQAKVESENSKMECYLCVVRYCRQIKDADVYLQYQNGKETVREHMYLDEFVRLYKE